MSLRPLDQRGISLTEVTVVGLIGVLVLIALGGFYLQSQATWLDASEQSITQRELTLLVETIADSTRLAGNAIVTNAPDSTHAQLALYAYGQPNPALWYFWWSPADSLVHGGTDPVNDDRGPLLNSVVSRFAVSVQGPLVSVSVRARAGSGRILEVDSSSLMRNYEGP